MKTYRSNPIKFNELAFIGPDGISDDIQLLRVGTFFHEGKAIEVTKKDLMRMIVNFDENVRGIDLMLDFSHDSHKEAAAWFESIYLSEDGQELWGKVEWTEGGSESVRKKEYRYISADFNFTYIDNETLKDHGPTLLGAGLTNRPVVKKMTPTILSENNNFNKDNGMTPEEIKTMKDENAKLKEDNKTLGEKIKSTDESLSESKLKDRETAIALRETNIKLSEEKLANEKIANEKKTEFDTMLSEGKAVEAQRDAFMKNDMQEFIKNASNVNLSEAGNGGTGKPSTEHNDSETPAQDEVIALAEKKVKEGDLNLTDAMSVVLSENKDLKAKYEKEVEL